jgi:DNA processing protein
MAAALPAEIEDLLALTLVPGLGPRLARALLERFGSAAAVRQAGEDQLRQVPQIGPKLAGQFASALATVQIGPELALVQQHHVRLLALGTSAYPAALAAIDDPPPLLYARGTLTAADANAVAVVGSRSCTPYGRKVTERLAAGLARAGFCVVSGLARGTDGVAHRAALQAGGRTLAVLAGGLSRIYPPEHADLAREVEAAGALLTESDMLQEPLAGLFPARNRIISGLSRAVVIVEAAEKSGALLTASHAAEQGRPVLAVPGPVDSPSSAGTHGLIRKGAILCRGVEDVLEELHGVSAMAQVENATAPTGPRLGPPAEPTPAPTGPPPGLNEEQTRVWEFLAQGPRSLDEITQQLGIPVPQLSTTLMLLEMRKAARRLPGSRFERA